MTKFRSAIPKAVKNSVLDEYNHKCAICAGERPHIHHIDEDPSNNDRLNLLPLCPNHHLTDQHNPTHRHESGKLRLFREYKDPAILKPQFQPIYDRIFILFDSIENLECENAAKSAKDLIHFVRQMETGAYYAEKLTELLKPRTKPGLVDLLDAETAHRSRLHRTASYQQQIAESRREVTRLCVELLRYQRWF